MYHTSPEKIEVNTINNFGIAGDCLFFSDNVYVMTEAEGYYVYEADFTCIDASELYDSEIIKEISQKFSVDEEVAENLLDSSISEHDLFDDEFLYSRTDLIESLGEMGVWLQGKKGECAKKMGYDGCEDVDEQGAVYIVPMKGRENELKLLRYENK